MIRAIVFDCFGVLVGSSFRDLYHAAGGDLEKDGAFITEMLGRANAALISVADFNAAIAGRLGISLARWQDVTERLQLPNEPLWDYIRTELRPHYKLALLSNANRGAAERRIPADKRALLDALIVSGEVGYVKPEREIYQLAADRLGVTFDEMVFTDDLPAYVQAAQQCGIHALQYRDVISFRRELTQLLVRAKEPR